MENEYDAVVLKNLHACGYHEPPSVETGWEPYFSTTFDRNFSATSLLLSLDMVIERISLSLGSIITHNQKYSEPTFIKVSSIKYSSIFFLRYDNFFGLYF